MPPGRLFQRGAPSLTISSVGSVATTMRGGTLGAALPASAGGSIFTRSAGGDCVGVHGPSGSAVSYQSVPLLSQAFLPSFSRTTRNGVFSARSKRLLSTAAKRGGPS